MTIAKELSEGKLGIGDYLWWSSGSIGTSWSCPCIILGIQNKSFRVKSYDTYEVSNWISFGNEDVLSEFRICNKEEVKNYLDARLGTVNQTIATFNGKKEQLKQQRKLIKSSRSVL